MLEKVTREAHPAARPWQMIYATHLFQSFLSHLQLLSLKAKRSGHFKVSMQRCGVAYDAALHYHLPAVQNFLAEQDQRCRGDLLEQLQKLVALNALYDAVYDVQLLKFAAILVELNGMSLPLDERSAKQMGFPKTLQKSWNLEELLARCVRQAEDFEAFCREASSAMLFAACAGVRLQEVRIKRIAHCATGIKKRKLASAQKDKKTW